jgi:nucleotide-binding universal stress UspA family protein
MQADFSVPQQPILLATNGQRESDGAVDVAWALSYATGRVVSVVSVLEPPPLVAGAYGFVVPVPDTREDSHKALIGRVRKQLNDAVGARVCWPVEVRTGNAATEIANAAEAVGAAVIVMGLGQHAVLDRALGSETALHTLRAAGTPILAVPYNCVGLPTRAVVGLDFSETCVAAARQALSLLPSLTRMILVQVSPRWDIQSTAYSEWRTKYEHAVAPGLDWAVGELAAPDDVTVTTEIREGKTAKSLLLAAEDYGADLIVVGSKGLGLLDRMLVGSTASSIIRSAQTAVFALPLAALAKQVSQPAGEEVYAVGA